MATSITASVVQTTITATVVQQAISVATIAGPTGPTGNAATKQIGASIRFPAVGSVLLVRLSEALTVTEVSCATDVGTVTFNIEKRATPAGAGSDLFAADQVATTSGIKVTTLQNAAWIDDEWIAVAISAVASSPTMFTMTITASAT